MSRIAIIGAGIAGLSLAQMLRRQQPALDIVIFDKSRGVGGRMATRYTDTQSFDHGAQFFTARSSEFQTFLAPHLKSGLVQPWNANLTTLSLNDHTYKRPWFEPHYVAQPRMTSLCKVLATDFDVRLGDAVTSVTRPDNQWQLMTDSGQSSEFDWIISTAPSEQTAQLLNISFDSVRFDPAFALMVSLTEAPSFDAAVVKHPDISWLAVTNSKPGRLPNPSLVVHSTGEYARTFFDDDRERVANDLADKLHALTGICSADLQLHRWKFAKVVTPWTDPCFLDPLQQLAACGDWFVGGRIEDSFASANHLASLLKNILR